MSGFLNDLGREAYRNAKARGAYDERRPPSPGDLLCHLHSEVDEVYKAALYENDKQAAIELADVIILATSIATYWNLDIEAAVREKMVINAGRVKG